MWSEKREKSWKSEYEISMCEENFNFSSYNEQGVEKKNVSKMQVG